MLNKVYQNTMYMKLKFVKSNKLSQMFSQRKGKANKDHKKVRSKH